MAFFEALLLVAGVLLLLYKWGTIGHRTFEERGIPFEKPLPIFGNAFSVLRNKEPMLTSVANFYNRNKAHKIFGYFNFRNPIIFVHNPEHIKLITVKDFNHFPNHHPFFNTNSDPLLDGMLTIMKDQRWKDMRNTLTPVFTTSKMRAMFPLMQESFDESMKYLREATRGGKPYEFELKQHFTRLSNDIIASTAFGLKLNSYVDRNNQFYTTGQTITNFRGAQMFKFFLSTIAPKPMAMLGISLFDKKTTDYFTKLVMDAMKYREENNIVRPDMVQMLMEARKESSHEWSDADIVAQCFIFFFAAFENNAHTICFTCHELMLNPDIQQRLYEEALEVQKELNGEPLTYDVVNKMAYMDMVISESMRMWTLGFITDRVCSLDYTLKDDDGNTVFEFKKGDKVWIPIDAMHKDEQYFEDPYVFNPERFSDVNKNSIKPFTYMPFGAGPRICIGNRYALMQTKAMLYYLILEFKFERSAKTVKNLRDDCQGFQINPKSGFWMTFKPRTSA